VNDTLAALTLLSVLSIVLETVSTLEQFEPLFRSIEYITVAAFTAEYAARFYVTRRRWQYAFSFFGVIDLLAIVPTYLGIGNLTYLKSARILRILRFLRILRLAKIGRSHILKHVSPVALNISIYVTALISAIIIFGTLIYIAEPESISFANIPLGMLWAAKALLGGLGGSTESQVPITQTGQIIALFARFTGLLLIGLLISVMGNIMRYVLTGARR
jgi:voltage-gated potassium channel